MQGTKFLYLRLTGCEKDFDLGEREFVDVPPFLPPKLESISEQ
jgi:hypothetical protein